MVSHIYSKGISTGKSLIMLYPKDIQKNISADWDGLPGNLDASFTPDNGKTYFFKGSQYWRFVNTKMDKGYPKQISKHFRGIPNNVDAALAWRGDCKIYFFKGCRSRPSISSSHSWKMD